MKKKYIIIVLLIICICWLSSTANQNHVEKYIAYSANTTKKVITANKLQANNKNLDTMKKNTEYLQDLIKNISETGGGTIKLPAGTFYFYPTAPAEKYQYYIIKCYNNVKIEGAGNNNKGTVLKPYTNKDLGKPIDMFYFNEYLEAKLNGEKNLLGRHDFYLENADFSDFIIDGEDATSKNYTTAGKGFMINLYKNCDWNNITVKNTDGTGFGMDGPINSTITNSTAIGCGKAATSSSGGASGFGIGTGYSNEESLVISNCIAKGNRKYGFFFEHQARFDSNYPATKSAHLLVTNSKSYGNMYNYGGEKSNDVIYKNNYSYTTSNENPLNITNISAIHFGSNSRRTTIEGMIVDNVFTDVKTTANYYEAVKWGVRSSIIEGGTGNNLFKPNNYSTRAEVITMLWRLENRPGDVLLKNTKITQSFADVNTSDWYFDAVDWGVKSGILSKDTNFNPKRNIKHSELIAMLWRLAGTPKTSSTDKFTDVKSTDWFKEALDWAVNKKIISINSTEFKPSEYYKKYEVIEILYNFAKKYNYLKISTNYNNYTNQTDSSNNQNKEEPIINSDKNDSSASPSPTPETTEDYNWKDIYENEEIPEYIDESEIENEVWTLKELYLTNGTMAFNPEEKSYTVLVPYDIKETEIIGTAFEESTLINGLGKKELQTGVNIFPITTITKDSKVTMYEIIIIRKEEEKNVVFDSNNSLKKLSLGNYNIELEKDKYIYDIPYSNLSNLNVTALPASDYSNVSIIGDENYKIGSQIKIIVTAEDGTNKIYTLNITNDTGSFIEDNLINILIILIVIAIIFLIGNVLIDSKKILNNK